MNLRNKHKINLQRRAIRAAMLLRSH